MPKSKKPRRAYQPPRLRELTDEEISEAPLLELFTYVDDETEEETTVRVAQIPRANLLVRYLLWVDEFGIDAAQIKFIIAVIGRENAAILADQSAITQEEIETIFEACQMLATGDVTPKDQRD